jgi:hypothetical protein
MDDERDAIEQDTYTIDQLIDEFVRTPEQQQRFLRTGWINEIMFQLIHARSEAGLTQKELGERMGKQQSAIARLESNNDIKLSTLFDYLAALGLAPVGEIPVKPYAEAASRFAANGTETTDAPSSGEIKTPTILAAD